MNRTLLFILFLSSSLKAYCFVNAGTIPSVTTGCAPLIVNFTDNSSSTNTISTWAYSFGDGGTSSQSNPKYVYSVAGKYRVILEVKDVNGNSDKDTVYIVVKRGPNANFSTPNASYCNNISIPFKNLSTDGDTGIRNCTWDFGDGQTATAKGDVTKAYSKEGTFNVILTVRDYNGCVNTIIKNNFITINPTPKADFTFNQIYSCTAPMNVNFKNKSTKNPTYVWDLGDGNTTTDANPSTAYGTEKKYNITLTATTSNGCMDVKTAILNVKFGEIKANFSMVSDVGCIPFTPGFTSTTKPDSVFFNYAWSFGDNTTSSAENPNKSYNKVGTYTIKLKVSGVGCSDSINKTLLVSDRPKPILKASDTLGCHGVLSTTLSAKCKLGNKWTWYIDGKNIENQTGVLNYYFGDTGIYKVIVQVDDSANCSETVQFTKMVVQDLKADWYFPDTNSCAPFYPGIKNTTFNALNAKLSYAWQQHDGKRTYIKIPTPYYPDTGKFNMRLIVKDQYGCMDSLEQIIPVGKRIKPDFTIDKTKVCIGEKVKFVNTTNSVLAKLVNIWYWQLGNIISSEKDSVITKLTQIPAFVNLMLVAEHNGCRTFIKKDTALMMQGAFANFDFSFDTCYSHNVRLRNASDSFTSIKWVMPDNSVRNDFEFTYAANPNADSKIRLIAYNTRTKCTDSITKVFGVPKSVSDIYYYFKPDCTPQMVTFYNKSYGAYRTHWEFGNGDTTDLLINKGDSFRYTYTSPGDFKIVLQGWDNKGCLYESSKILSIKGPAVESKVWPLKGCLPLTINLKDSNSNATIKKKFWLINYKDTVRISKKGPITTFTINEMPLYDSLVSFTLVVMDSNGCVSSKTHHVRPYGPKADVLITRKTSCDAMRCYFNAEIDSISTALPVKITWNLGDGNNVYNSTKAEHIYGTEGYYYPVYTMTDAAGCVYEEKLVLYSTEPVLLAKFGIANNIGKCPPLLAEFTDRSIQNGSPIEEYLWDLGEGYISYEQNPGKLFTHSGNFDIKLTVKNSLGCTNTFVWSEAVKVGGPVAAYTIKNKTGCAPLKVEYQLNSKNLLSNEWDFGTGQTSVQGNIVKMYADTGRFYPKLILKDSFNCQNILILKDTISVSPKPKAVFNIDANCKDAPINFSNSSYTNSSNNTYKSNWLVNTHSAITKDYSEKFNTIGSYTARLIVENNAACMDTAQKDFEISKPIALFKTAKYQLCLGDSAAVDNLSSSAIGPVQSYWMSNNTLIGTNQELKFYPKVGNALLKLIVFDKYNCRDTMTDAISLHVADTAAPEVVQLMNASRQSTDAELSFTGSNDVDFKNYTLYHFENGNWKNIFACTKKDTAFFLFNCRNFVPQSHCFKITQTNVCGAESELINTIEHCTIHTTATSALNSNLVNWSAYVGWPVANYYLLRENLNKASNYDTLAIVNGSVLNFVDTTVQCTINHTYKVVGVANALETHSDTAKAKASWTNTLPIPELISASVKDNENIVVKWQLPVNYKRSQLVDVFIYPYTNNSIRLPISITEREFKDVEVQNASYRYTIRFADDCKDTSPMSNIGKSIWLQQAPMAPYEAPQFFWTAYQKWPTGVEYYEVQRMNENNVFETVLRTTDTFFTDIYSPTSGIKQYRYRILAVKTVNGANDYIAESLSNELLIVPNSIMHVPNAFTPNGNGINELFKAEGLYIYDYHLEIYNRWGEQVFNSNNAQEGWDGTYNNEPCQQDVYFYKIEARGNDYKKYVLKGTVSLLR